MTNLCRKDREWLDLVSEVGVPRSQSTRDWAVDDLLPRLWAEYKALRAEVDELLEATRPQEPAQPKRYPTREDCVDCDASGRGDCCMGDQVWAS